MNLKFKNILRATILSGAAFIFNACWDNTTSLVNQDEALSAATTAAITKNLTPTGDTYLRAGTYEGVKYGTSKTLEALSDGTENNFRYAAFKFNVSTYSAVSSVKLRLYMKYGSAGSATCNVVRLPNVSWNENTITNNTLGGWDANVQVSATITGTSFKWVEFDVTSIVQSEFALGHHLISLGLFSNQTTTSPFVINSKESTSNKPVLVVTGDLKPTGPANLAPTFAVEPTVTLDPDNASNHMIRMRGLDDAGTKSIRYQITSTVPNLYFGYSQYSQNPDVEQTSTFQIVSFGTYNFTLTLTDEAGLTASRNLTLVVNPVVSMIMVPDFSYMNANTTQQFTTTFVDQFGNPAVPNPLPTITYSTTSGAGTITSSGLFTAGNYNCQSRVIASATGYQSALANIYIENGIQPDANSNLLAAWFFDPAGGTTLTDYGPTNLLNGTLVNGPIETTGNPEYNAALSFDGINDYVELGNPTALKLTGSMTISAIFKLNKLGTAGRIISKQGASGSNQRGWNLGMESDNKVYFSIASSATTSVQISTNSAIGFNEFVHVVAVYDATAKTMKIYLNGFLSKTLTTGVPASQYNSSLNVRIGMRPIGDLPFTGVIDDMLVYNRPLSEGDVFALYGNRLY